MKQNRFVYWMVHVAKVQPVASFAKLTQKNDLHFEQLLTIYCDVKWFRITNFELCY